MKHHIITFILSAFLVFFMAFPQTSISAPKNKKEISITFGEIIQSCLSRTNTVRRIISFRDAGMKKEKSEKDFLKAVDIFNNRQRAKNLPDMNMSKIMSGIAIINWIYDDTYTDINKLSQLYYARCIEAEAEENGITVIPQEKKVK